LTEKPEKDYIEFVSSENRDIGEYATVEEAKRACMQYLLPIIDIEE